MKHFLPGTMITYQTPNRTGALGMVLDKELFLPKFLQERGSWPTGESYTKQIEVQYGFHLPFKDELDDEHLFDRMWAPCGRKTGSRTIMAPKEFLASNQHVAVKNIEDIFGRTRRLYEIVLTPNCQIVEQMPKTNLKFVQGSFLSYAKPFTD